MQKVVTLQVVREKREASVEKAWQRYVTADAKAKATLAIDDGIAAGIAYRDFLELFVRKAS